MAKKFSVYLPDTRHAQMQNLARLRPDINWSAIANESFQLVIDQYTKKNHRENDMLDQLLSSSDFDALKAAQMAYETSINDQGFQDGVAFAVSFGKQHWERLDAFVQADYDKLPNDIDIDSLWARIVAITTTLACADDECWNNGREEDMAEMFWSEHIHEQLLRYDMTVCEFFLWRGVDYVASFLRAIRKVHDRVCEPL